MPSYEIRVRSDDPLRAAQAMHGAEIPTIGWGASDFVRTPAGDWTIGDEFTAFVAAEDLRLALDRLRGVDADFAIVADPWLFHD
jgi:hypothetical protein